MRCPGRVCGNRRVKKIIAIFLIALALRMILLGAWWQAGYAHRLSGDSYQYHEIGKNLSEGKGFHLNGQPTARRVPLYPVQVGMIMKAGIFPWGLQFLQALL